MGRFGAKRIIGVGLSTFTPLSKKLTGQVIYPMLRPEEPVQAMELLSLFEQINQTYFDAFLEPPVLRWNSRLRSSAGRFVPGSRKFFREAPPVIEIASYLLEEQDAPSLVSDTLGHEMIHYWLWVRRRPYGHTPEFWDKMHLM